MVALLHLPLAAPTSVACAVGTSFSLQGLIQTGSKGRDDIQTAGLRFTSPGSWCFRGMVGENGSSLLACYVPRSCPSIKVGSGWGVHAGSLKIVSDTAIHTYLKLFSF